jgi:hypothetical protein
LLVRNERVDEAHELLLEAEKALTADTMLAASERLYCSADFALTRCRILEWRARNGRGGWEDCLAHASRSREEVLAWRTLPPRFGAELHLHLGLANIRCSRIKAALKALESPATRRAPNVSTRVALSFARAEAYVRLKREDDGRRHWETGRHELAGVGSPFLEDWDRQLARALQRRVPLDKPFEEAEKEFQRMYIEFQLDRFLKENGPLPDKGALEAFAEYLGWSGSTLRRHLKKLRLKLDALDRLREP